MPTTVDIPGVGEVDFPDSMDDGAIEHAIRTNILKTQAQPAPKGGDPFQQADQRSPLARTAKGAISAVEGTARMIANPPKAAADEIARSASRQQWVKDDLKHGRYGQAALNAAKAIPFLGGAVEQLAEGKGYEVAGGLLAGRALAEVPGVAGKGARKTAALPEVVMEEIRKPGTGKMAAGAAEVVGGGSGVLSGHPVAAAVGVPTIVQGVKMFREGLAERRAAAMDRLSKMAEPPPPPGPVRPPVKGLLGPAPIVTPPPADASGLLPQEAAQALLRERGGIHDAPVPEIAPGSTGEPYALVQDPFKSTDAYAQGVELMRARRRGAQPAPPAPVESTAPAPQMQVSPAPGPQLVPEPPGGDVALIDTQSTPRSRGELAPGPTGQHQMPLGFSPESFAAGARDAKMMDLADTLFVAGVEPEIAHLMRAKDWQQTAAVATRMKVEALAAEKGIPVAAAEQMVRPVKIPSGDTVKLIVEELKRRGEMLAPAKVESMAPKVEVKPSKAPGRAAVPAAAKRAMRPK